MAAKSDFAQKLLNDLRLRKERMGVSQGSAHNQATARDAYRNPGSMQRGSRHTKSFSDSKSMNQQLISSRGSNQALNIKESSQQIVSYRQHQHQRSESTGDLSMAFTYAVNNNGGKLMNVDFSTSNYNNTNTMIDFLNQIGRRSFTKNTRNGTTTSLVKHRPANGVVAPALTTIQIKEISKGVQNLYEIIRSTSNGANVNRYSMEVGKELLKGAKGLEESLRMLVNLQEASEMMVNPQRKSRVTLLEVVDDDDKQDQRSKTVGRNDVALPRFSFDKPSKKSNSPVTGGCNNFPANQWSAAGKGESVGSVRSEKGRISNVIAKLMGLEEVPVKVESYSGREKINKPSRPVKECVIPGTMELNSNRDEVKKAYDLNKNTVKKSSRPQQIHDSNANGESRMNEINKNNRSERVSDQKIRSKRRSPEAAANPQVEKKKTVRNNKIQEPERRVQKIKQDSQQMKPVKNPNPVSKESKPQTFEGNQKVKDLTPEAHEPERTQQKMVPMARKKVDSVAVVRTESTRIKDEVLRRRNQTVYSLLTPLKHKLSVLKETNRNEVRTRSEPEEINTRKANSISSVNKAESTTGSRDIVPVCKNETKRDPEITSEIIVAGTNAGTNIRKADSISNANKTESTTRSCDIVLVCGNETKRDSQITSEIVVAGTNVGTNIRKADSISNANKTESTTRLCDIVLVCGNETKRDPQITSEIVVAGTNAGTNIRKADSISNANKTESTTRSCDIVPLCGNETKRDPQITSEIVVAGTNVEIPYKSNLSENKPKKAFDSSICENETKWDLRITSEIVVHGTNARIPDKSNLSENKPKKAFYSSIQVVLTEQEKQLKEILIKDQLFLSMAEALFKLNIPVGFLHVDDNNHHDNETKLKLDCGYEILKRKARSQELSVHPYIKPSIGDTIIKFLDELVKQLYKDLEGVRLYGRDTHNEYDEADYLHHMLEKDIHNKNPDINSFWDFGWHITTFAFVEKDEFVSDVEQDTFSRLVDEFVDDLLSV